MKVGVVREVKPGERRVALTPVGAAALANNGHQVTVETGAGEGAGFTDEHYRAAGAGLCSDAAEVWGAAELLLKVKEPVDQEHDLLHDELILFTYLHLAADCALTEALLDSGTTAIAYETVEDDGRLPLLAPMSEIAGRLAASAAAHHLQHPYGGPGVLIGGAPGVRPARVLVVGGGVVGTEAAAVAHGMGAEVVLLERSLDRIRSLDARFHGQVRVLASADETLLDELRHADACIGEAGRPTTRSAECLGPRRPLRRLRAGLGSSNVRGAASLTDDPSAGRREAEGVEGELRRGGILDAEAGEVDDGPAWDDAGRSGEQFAEDEWVVCGEQIGGDGML